MAGYFDVKESDTSPIRREEALLPEYLPDEISHRENELQAVADSIKPLIHKRTPENLYIFGKPGVGKTMSIKFLIRELLSSSSSVLPVYLNCWENPTLVAVYNRIIESMRLPLPRRGLGSDEIFDKILQYIKNYDRRVLLVLDDADGLQQDTVLQSLAKANEHGVMFGIILIANNKEPLINLEPRVRSSIHFVEMEFKQYNQEQIESILRRRAGIALAPDAFDERILTKIARSIPDGSARLAIERLWRASKRAEKANRSKIMLQDIEDCIDEESTFKREELDLGSEEKLILEELKDGELESSELYKRLESKTSKTKRHLRNYLESLEKKGLIESRELKGEGLIKPKAFKLKK